IDAAETVQVDVADLAARRVQDRGPHAAGRMASDRVGEAEAAWAGLEQHPCAQLDDRRLAFERTRGVEQPRKRPVHTGHSDSLSGSGLDSRPERHPNTNACTPIGVLRVRRRSARLWLDRVLASQPGARSHVTGRRATSPFFAWPGLA